MRHFLQENLGLITCKRQENYTTAFITKHLIDQRCFSVPGSVGKDYAFPLYLYSDAKGQQSLPYTSLRTPNLNLTIVKQIEDKLLLTFTNEKETTEDTFAPIDLLDYIYAVLHSPAYREAYKAFLKIDFPRLPYPTDREEFWRLVNIGGELRQVHLLESAASENYITQYPVDGDNFVGKIRFELSDDEITGRVWINEVQYFDTVPQSAWDFYIGGYQPAQKWLKDRKGGELGFEDILHYQKIIVALTETGRLMEEIDETINMEAN